MYADIPKRVTKIRQFTTMNNVIIYILIFVWSYIIFKIHVHIFPPHNPYTYIFISTHIYLGIGTEINWFLYWSDIIKQNNVITIKGSELINWLMF